MMTVSSSRGSTLNKDAHQNLFVEPVRLPNMTHLQVESSWEPREACLFYPSGHKNRQMRNELEATVRSFDVKMNDESNTRPPSNEKFSRKESKNLKQTAPLHYSRKINSEMKELMRNVRQSEGKIHGTINSRF